MDDSMVWLIGAVAFVIVIAAFVWVLRHRDVTSLPEHHTYETPEITLTGTQSSGVTFGSSADEGVVDEPLDETVPLSRLGGAGWRDGGAPPVQQTTDAYAVESPSWVDDGSSAEWDGDEHPHVTVDDTGPRPLLDEIDRERGGHW
ncbi:hypothetical protein N802_05830 [Knoellia sinensis KCTC 19936]|uniref:Uncharacterized protein n=1 Tax=Knoellia sinensis KCTC 19936 TaxID=1385520 RepID=A0A0A0J5M5_9MICO|nr:hypothetical protein [Knoellia sinensis]KGN30916.1 hypothetical protein N802_05830 [Knoellia sinensis KCTC 19936]